MAIFKEILRNDGSGITRFYRIDNGSITTLDYDALMNKPRINGKELIGDILIDISDFDLSNYYTKKETNTTIQAQLVDYYTKKETDNQITKATKTEKIATAFLLLVRSFNVILFFSIIYSK